MFCSIGYYIQIGEFNSFKTFSGQKLIWGFALQGFVRVILYLISFTDSLDNLEVKLLSLSSKHTFEGQMLKFLQSHRRGFPQKFPK